MIGIRIAAATRHLRQPFRKALHTAATLGVEGVQIDARDELRPADITDTAARQLKKLLEEGRLLAAGAVLPTRRGLLHVENADRRLAAINDAMAMIARLGGRTLVTNLGDIPEADSPARSDARQLLNLVAAAGQRLGVTPVMAAPGAEPTEVVELLREAPEGTLGLEFHPGDLLQHDHAPSEWLATAGPLVAAVTASDAVRDLGGGGVMSVELGRGVVPLDELFAQLQDQFQYRGWAVIGRGGVPAPAEEMANAAMFLRRCSE